MGISPADAMQVTWPEYLTYLIVQLPPSTPVDDVSDVKSRMRKMRDKAKKPTA